MSDLFPITLMDMIVELERELVQRKRVYPRLIANGTLKQDKADRQVAVLRQAYLTLQQLNGTRPAGRKDDIEEFNRWLHGLTYSGVAQY